MRKVYCDEVNLLDVWNQLHNTFCGSGGSFLSFNPDNVTRAHITGGVAFGTSGYLGGRVVWWKMLLSYIMGNVGSSVFKVWRILLTKSQDVLATAASIFSCLY